MKHPDEDYWRLSAEMNEDIDFETQMKIFREERKLLEQFEIEAQEEK